MAYFVVQDFRAGVDVTRPPYMSEPGTLQRALNCHLTRGGDIEKRKAFVSKYALPAGTFGLAAVGGQLYTFGSAVAPVGMPAGVTYVRLQDGAKVMNDVLQVDTFNGKLYVAVQWTDATISHFYDGVKVAAWFDGRARGSFTVNGGAINTDTITSVKVNAVEILGSTIQWGTSHAAVAQAIATQINAFASTPEYTASAVGATVYIEATAAAGTTPNGFPVAVTVTGAMSVTTPNAMAGGVAPGSTYTPGMSIRTFKSKLYSTSGGNLHSSAIDTPSDWTTTNNGAWFVNLSNYASGAQALICTAKYFGNLVVFAADSVLIWNVFSDPADNAQIQEIPDIGVLGRKATTTYRDGSTYFLSDQGVKALTARDASNFAVVADASTAIDPILVAAIADADAATKAGSIITVEPEEGRIWVILGTSIFVLSSFTRGGIRAWSEYTPGFAATSVAINARRIYLRSGDTVYLYGGDDNATYDTSVAEALLPYATMRAPATMKNLIGLDIGAEGSWSVYVREEADTENEALVAENYNGLSFDRPMIPVQARSTHISVRLVHDTAEYARLSAVALHYQQDEARTT